MTIFMSRSDDVTAIITILTAAVFVFLGLRVRDYAAGSFRRHPFGLSIFQEIVKRSRFWQLQCFQRLVREIIRDTDHMLEEKKTVMETRAMIPLVSDARKKGEHLLATQQFFHTYLSRNERQLRETVTQLTALDQRLKSLPRSSLSLDDVLAGRFSTEQFLEQGVQNI